MKDIVSDRERERERMREIGSESDERRGKDRRIRERQGNQPGLNPCLFDSYGLIGIVGALLTRKQNYKTYNKQGFVPVFDNAIWLDWHLLISKPSLSLCLLSYFETQS